MSAEIAARLRQRADASRRAGLQRFFKTGPGEYAEGDVFIGVPVPLLRQVCRECRDAAIPDLVPLLGSAVHEERLLALLLLVEAFKRGTEEKKREIYRLYLGNTKFINNWDGCSPARGPRSVASPVRRLCGSAASASLPPSSSFAAAISKRPFESPTCCWPTATI